MIRDWPTIAGLAGLMRPSAPKSSQAIPPQPKHFAFDRQTLDRLRTREQDAVNRERLFRPAAAPPFAFSSDGDASKVPSKLANDDALQNFAGWAVGSPLEFGYGSGMFWLGYPYLAELSQRPEYRIIVELFADEMTRKWIKLKSTGKTDKSEKIKQLEAAMKRLGLRDAFRNAKRDDGYFGRGQLYPQLKKQGGGMVWEDPELLRSPLIIDKRTIARGSLVGFRKVEPYWTYPQAYNSDNPLRDDFFKPTAWTIMGNTVHDSRMMMFIGNPVPDLLKAAYSFGGISIVQLMKPYVDAFLRTKGSVNDLISAFSTMVLATNMSAYLNNMAGKSLEDRIEAYNLMRDNFGAFIIDKDTEDFKNVQATLATLDELQAQAEEHMLIPMRTPLLKAFGLSPSGLNTSNDNEIRSFYDNINADQEDEYRTPLERALKIIQLSETGEIDDEIDFDFVPLWQLDEAGMAAVQKTLSDIDIQNIEAGKISPKEARQRDAANPESPYHGLEGDAPGNTMVDGDGAPHPIDDPETNVVDKGGEAGSSSGANRGA